MGGRFLDAQFLITELAHRQYRARLGPYKRDWINLLKFPLLLLAVDLQNLVRRLRDEPF